MSCPPAHPLQGLKLRVSTLLCCAGPEQSARPPRCGVSWEKCREMVQTSSFGVLSFTGIPDSQQTPAAVECRVPNVATLPEQAA